MTKISFKFLASAGVIPSGFIYPSDYLDFSKKGSFPDLRPWSFLWENELDSLADGLKKRYPNRSLVPFARRIDCDDMACFEGADASGNPVVHIIHDYSSPGWEQRGTLKSFTEWLQMAMEEAEEWRAENEEDE